MLQTLTERSIKKHFYPLRDVAWSEHDPREPAWFLPEGAVSLFGTPAWDGLTEDERKRLSLHEFSHFCGLSMWLENALIQGLLDRANVEDPREVTHRYRLIEIGEEVQHNLLFSEFIRWAKVSWQPPRYILRLSGRWQVPLEARLSEAWLMTIGMVGEEVVDAINRVILQSKQPLHPLAREVALIHRVEEARHLAYARGFLAERYAREGRLARAYIRFDAPLAAFALTAELVREPVFRAAGLRSPAKLARIARRNPRHRAFRISICSRLVETLRSIGIVTASSSRWWRRYGLVGAQAPGHLD